MASQDSLVVLSEPQIKTALQGGKVIIFDSWTEGVVNIERLVPAFRDRGLELMLLHIGSWGHDQARPHEEHIRDVLVRDISYYQGLSFKEILLRERPAAVLFLSTQAFAHRAFNRYCRQLAIPTLHLYHGIVGVQSSTAKCVSPVNVRNQIVLAWSRLAKNLFRLWPLYAKALRQTGASLTDWFWFCYDVWRQVLGQAYSRVAAPDTSTTACCVYTHADISHAMQRYRLPRDAVYAVGNPDLEKFGLKENEIGHRLYDAKVITKDVVYIDAALIEVGAVFDDAGDYAKHLQATNAALTQDGCRLVVKLHPAHYRTGFADYLSKLGVELCDNGELVSRLKTSSCAIVEASSAALIPALLGLPILLARYGKLSAHEYGDVLTHYPRACELYSLNDFTRLLEQMTKIECSDSVSAWIKANAGPLPAGQMPGRVVDVIQRMAPDIGKSNKLRSGTVA